MARCDLTIELDREGGARYRPGETIAGRLFVDVDKDCRCDALTLSLAWATDGPGENSGDTAATIEMGEHRWSAGESYEIAFEIEAPDGPLSHAGQVVSVGWELRATAALAWAFDAEAKKPLLLAAWNEPPLLEMPDDYRSAPRRWEGDYILGPHVDEEEDASVAEVTASGGGGAVVAGLILALLGMGATLWLARQPKVESWGTALGLCIGVVLLGLGGAIWSLRGMRGVMGQSTLRVVPGDVRAGDKIKVEVLLDPRRPWLIEALPVRVHGYEHATKRVTTGSGKNRRTTTRHYTHTVYEKHFDLAPGGTVSARKRVKRTLRIPADAPPAFGAGRTHIRWEVQATVEIARLPDHECKTSFIVRPPRPPESD